MATPFAGILPLTGDILIDSMTTGFRWNSDGPIYYSFSDGFNDEVWSQPSAVSTQIQNIFAVFDYYIAHELSYKGGFPSPDVAATSGSNINFSLDSVYISEDSGNNTWATGFFPSQAYAQVRLGELYYQGAEGDIYLNINSAANSIGYDPGEAGFFLALHEIGHTLGLKHPHDAFNGRPSFAQAGIENRFDMDWVTVMSYNDDYNWNNHAWDPATPMILDVIALQYLYGADTSTNAGNSVFQIDGGTNAYLTIFDASGTDTIDLSSFNEGAYIDLPKYVVSENQYAPFGLVTSLADREEIDIGGSPRSLAWILGDIEKVVGSPFGDRIDGSDANEIILAAGGFDEIYVGGGDDMVDGGSGTDLVYFLAEFEDCEITFDGDTCIVESVLDGRNTLTNVEKLIFDYSDIAVARLVSDLASGIPPVPAPSDWRLLAGDGQFFAVGGKGQLFGTSDFQQVIISQYPGIVSFDASFNKGGDIVALSGIAADWQAIQQGSSVTLSNGETFAQIPAGTTGMILVFDDGARLLRIDTTAGVIKIGMFSVSDQYGHIITPPEGLAAPPGFDEDAVGRLLMSEGGEVFAAGAFQIYGTPESETIHLEDGDFFLDGSFNKGGDHVQFGGDVSSYTAVMVGSSVVIEGQYTRAQIPFGLNSVNLTFADAEHPLYFDGVASVKIGDQVISATASPLTFA